MTWRERSLGTDRTGTLPSSTTGPRSRCMGLPPSPRSFQQPPEQPPPHIHSPPNLPVAKVLYLLDVAMVTQAGASCQHPGGQCFPLPGRARAGGAWRAPHPVFLVSGEARSRILPWAPWERSVPPSDLPPPHEHTPRERSGLGAPTRTSVGPQRPPARGTGDGAEAAQATLPAREPRDCGGSCKKGAAAAPGSEQGGRQPAGPLCPVALWPEGRGGGDPAHTRSERLGSGACESAPGTGEVSPSTG